MRVKRGYASRRRHKRIMNEAEGYRGRRKNAFKLAKLAVQRAGKYAYRHRRLKKREFRQLWIARINAAARACGLSYSRLISGAAKANIGLDRKMLAEIAVHDPVVFAEIAQKAKSAAA